VLSSRVDTQLSSFHGRDVQETHITLKCVEDTIVGIARNGYVVMALLRDILFLEEWCLLGCYAVWFV
jgi:hypothetical protein